jgi:hypothetical protein
MKLLLSLLITTQLLLAAAWNIDTIIAKGYKLETVCKLGLLHTAVSGKVGKIPFVVEELYCTDYSAWDGECLTPPVPCTPPKE